MFPPTYRYFSLIYFLHILKERGIVHTTKKTRDLENRQCISSYISYSLQRRSSVSAHAFLLSSACALVTIVHCPKHCPGRLLKCKVYVGNLYK